MKYKTVTAKYNSMKTRQYHSLLVREDDKSPWCVHFGDYDLATVRAERDDITEHEYKRSNTQIITTGNLQRDIENALKDLNSK